MKQGFMNRKTQTTRNSFGGSVTIKVRRKGEIPPLPHSDPCFSKWVLMVRLLGLACKLSDRHFPFALCCIFGCLAVGQQNKKGCPPKVLPRFYARSSLEAQGGWIEPHFICMCRESPRSNLRSLKSTSDNSNG